MTQDGRVVRTMSVASAGRLDDNQSHRVILTRRNRRVSALVRRPTRAAEHCDQSFCVSVLEHISGTAGPVFTNFLCVSVVAVALFWWCWDTLCTSGFVDNVTFSRNGPNGRAGGLQLLLQKNLQR